MTRGEIQVFMASLRVIREELAPIRKNIPEKVYAEISAMEKFLKKDYEDRPGFR